MERKKVVQEYYSRRVEEYDSQKRRTWRSKEGFAADVLSEVFGALTGLKGKRILEVGVGSGRISLPLSEKVKPQLVGLDISKEMLRLAKAKMRDSERDLELVLGDGEHLPFADDAFEALICISTMHYFESSEKALFEFSEVLKTNGVLVYGELVLHESDEHCFLEALERTLSMVHRRYYKSSEMKNMLKNLGFSVLEKKVFPYRKSFSALMEDKGKYFSVKLESLAKVLNDATAEERKLYSVDGEGLTLLFALVIALKASKNL